MQWRVIEYYCLPSWEGFVPISLLDLGSTHLISITYCEELAQWQGIGLPGQLPFPRSSPSLPWIRDLLGCLRIPSKGPLMPG